MLTRTGKIYSLSGEDGVPFYVGCTTQPMEVRLNGHLSDALGNNSLKCQHIRLLDFKITATILELVEVSGNNGYQMRKALAPKGTEWINKFLEQGIVLTNVRDRMLKIVQIETVGSKFQSDPSYAEQFVKSKAS